MQIKLGVYAGTAAGAANVVSTRRSAYLYGVKPENGECIKQLVWKDSNKFAPCIDTIEPGAFNDLVDLEEFKITAESGPYSDILPMSYSGLLWQPISNSITLVCCPQRYFQSVNAVELPGVPNGYQNTIVGDYAFYNVKFRVSGDRDRRAPFAKDGSWQQFCFTSHELQQVDSLGDCSFANTNLTKLMLWPELTKVGMYAFMNCHDLQSVVYMNSSSPFCLTKIPTGMFYNCESLVDVEIPEGVVYISTNAFAHCSSLKSVKIPKTLSCICKDAFKGCGNVDIIVPPDSQLQHIGIEEHVYLAGEPNLAINKCRASDIQLEYYRNNYAIQNIISRDAIGGAINFVGQTPTTKLPRAVQKIQGGK